MKSQRRHTDLAAGLLLIPILVHNDLCNTVIAYGPHSGFGLPEHFRKTWRHYGPGYEYSSNRG
jgi:hypothetical protein